MSAHPDPVRRCEPEGHCVTCGDDGVPMSVLKVDAAAALAICADANGGREDVAVDLVDPVQPGDILLVHAGVALVRLEEQTA